MAFVVRDAAEAARDYCRSSITFTGAGSLAVAAVVGAGAAEEGVAVEAAVGAGVAGAGVVAVAAVAAASVLGASGVAGASSFTVARIHSSLLNT